MEKKIQELRDLCAAYEATLQYDYCPEPSEVEDITENIETFFSAEEFRRGTEKYKGRSGYNIANLIVKFVGEWEVNL